MSKKTAVSSNKFVLGALIVVGVIALVAAVVLLATVVFARMPLNDFTNTFYRAGNYMLRGENVYLNAYPDVRDGREYPPYSPLWVVFPAIPFALLPLHIAEALRFLLELAFLPLLAVITARWAGLHDSRKTLLLLIAPWFAILILAGQLSVFIYTGLVLCYVGMRRANGWMIGVGLALVLLKPHIVMLVVLAVLLYAWRNRVLLKSFGVLAALALVSWLVQPGWVNDLVSLTLARLRNPQVLQSVHLLPGYPYAQLTLILGGGLALVIYFLRTREPVPSKWLWSVLVAASLIAGLHTLPYDWLNLMLPLALLLRQRWGVWLTVGLYVYPLLWGVFLVGFDVNLVSPTVIPTVVLGALFAKRYLARRSNELSRVAAAVGS